MPVVDFSADAEIVFSECGLSPAYLNALRKPVYDLRVMRSAPVQAAPIRRHLRTVESAARRLQSSLRAIDGHPSSRSAGSIAGFLLDEALTLKQDGDDVAVILDGQRFRDELERLKLLIECAEFARQHMDEFVLPNPKGRQKLWCGVRPIYEALQRQFRCVHSAALTPAAEPHDLPAFLVVSHTPRAPFRRIVDACYAEAGRPEGVPEKAFEAFVTWFKAGKSAGRRND